MVFFGDAIKNKTIIAIARRLSTIKNAGKIIVAEDGRVMEKGQLTDVLE
ncbi:MAG: hypothetical protein PHT53_02290 [Candidatus Omnitrophica bacterium]|nr:hypothetical protein [Candidatus Omnitrophota bacterium]